MEMFKYPGLSSTASMMMNMMKQLSTIPTSTIPTFILSTILTASETASAAISAVIPTVRATAKYSIYMNNYFTSVPLFQLLRERGYEACGITRSKSKKFAFQLMKLHQNYFKSLSWGTIYAISVGNVLCFVFHQNNLVLE